jgi:hypothetical protein
MKGFLSRPKQAGMSIEQVARKSGMKPEDMERSLG